MLGAEMRATSMLHTMPYYAFRCIVATGVAATKIVFNGRHQVATGESGSRAWSEGCTPRSSRRAHGQRLLGKLVLSVLLIWLAASCFEEQAARPKPVLEKIRGDIARVVIYAEPSTVRISIDDVSVGDKVTPYQTDLDPGKHKIVISHPDYLAHQAIYELDPGKRNLVQVSLTRKTLKDRAQDRQMQLDQMFMEAVSALEKKKWNVCIKTVKDLLKKDAKYKDGSYLLRHCELERDSQTIFAKASKLLASDRGKAAAMMLQILELSSYHKEATDYLKRSDLDPALVKKIVSNCSSRKAGKRKACRKMIQKALKKHTENLWLHGQLFLIERKLRIKKKKK